MNRIYLDHAATTPLHPAALEAMLPWLDSGNPSSLHAEGRRAREALDEARERVSGALGCAFSDVVFTSGGTEAANLAILGVALANEDPRRKRVILGASEHHCVLHTRSTLERLGYRVDLLPVTPEAVATPERIDERIGEDVLLVSVMHANNELGTISPIPELAALAHRWGAAFHTDAVQTFRKLSWTAGEMGADLISVSAHKIGGPKAVGALYVRPGVKLSPLVGGGGQEREMRGGTENVAGIVGFGAAAAAGPLGHVSGELRDQFLASLESLGAVRTVRKSPVLQGHAHARFPGRDAGTFLIALDRIGISASGGAACSSGSIEPSHVLLACGCPPAQAREGIRFTLSESTTSGELEEAATRIARLLRRTDGLR